MVLSGTHTSGPPTHPEDLVGKEMLSWLHGAQDQALKDAQAGRYTRHPASKGELCGYMASS